MDELIKIRKYLHAHPELSAHEINSRRFIVKSLQQIGINEIIQNISLNSILAVVTGKNPGQTILLRCELDALPIDEINEFSHQSQTRGISHACGHDGHMTIMLGLAKEFVSNPPENGRVILLFQSAEETGQGAKGLVDSGVLENQNIDYVFALHNMPGYGSTDIICKTGIFTPVVESTIIKLAGKTSHAGEPEKGINPARTVAKIIKFFEDLRESDKSNPSYFQVTPIQIQMGEEAFGTSAGEATIKYTFRAWDNILFESTKNEIEKKIRGICSKERGLGFKLSWVEPFKPNMNHPEACEIVERAAKLNNYSYIKKVEPLTWGEDFGLLTEIYKGAMFGIGAGLEHPSLHNPDYDFPDDLIQPGINMFLAIVNGIVSK